MKRERDRATSVAGSPPKRPRIDAWAGSASSSTINRAIAMEESRSITPSPGTPSPLMVSTLRGARAGPAKDQTQMSPPRRTAPEGDVTYDDGESEDGEGVEPVLDVDSDNPPQPTAASSSDLIDLTLDSDPDSPRNTARASSAKHDGDGYSDPISLLSPSPQGSPEPSSLHPQPQCRLKREIDRAIAAPPPVTALNTSGRSRLFCGICVCILPQRMPKAQREALRDAVCRRGGLADDAVSERTTHVVTLLTGREVVARFPSMKSSIFVVGPSFVNEAIRTGRTQTDLPTVESCVAASVTQKSLIKQRSIDEGEETEELVDEKGSLALVLKSHDDGEDGEKPSLMPLSPSSSPLTKAPSQPLWLVGQSTLPFKQNAADISDGSDNSTDDSGATDTSDGVTSDDGGGGEVRLHSGHRRRRHVPALTRASVSAALYGDDEGGNVGTEAQEKSGETTEEEAEYVEKTPYGKKLRNQSSWACMRRAPTLLDDTNQNAHITSEFDRLVKRALADGDEWRRVEDVEGIRGIGKQMRKKILEILRTGFVRKAHSIPENLEVLEMFQNVYGIGKKIARKLL
ncbi:hypothetical protein DFJ73DRAFT_794354 [Zopfochytrium polystomum]|nr:hypothetical protein DFJ73DRAFT_794354 [Zopfochytrium polystomum]